MKTIEARFWEKVDKQEDVNSCWEWTASKKPSGYGELSVGGRGGRIVRAHRLSYEMHFGAIPPGMLVLHRCDNPSCVRPDHLFVGTHEDNMNDRDKKKRGKATFERGERHAQAKLTDAQVAEIRSRYASGGMTHKQLASEYNISESHISGLVCMKCRPDPVTSPGAPYSSARTA